MSVRINLEIGHEAVIRSKRTIDGFTHDWHIYVQGIDGADIQYYIEKVVFLLHETFPNPKRVIKEPPYSVRESGYAGFVIPIEIYLRNNEEPKKIRFNYDLNLQTTGPAINKTQKEKYVFLNPSEEFRHKLLKGGAALQTDNSRDVVPSSNEKQHMSNKPKLSGSSESFKKHKNKEHKAEDSFTDLFGTPITKTSKISPDPAIAAKNSPSSNSLKTEKSSSSKKSKSKHSPKEKDKERDKDKEKKEKNTEKKHKEEKKNKERNKDKERKEKSSKREKSPKPQSPSPLRRSPKRSSSPKRAPSPKRPPSPPVKIKTEEKKIEEPPKEKIKSESSKTKREQKDKDKKEHKSHKEKDTNRTEQKDHKKEKAKDSPQKQKEKPKEERPPVKEPEKIEKVKPEKIEEKTEKPKHKHKKKSDKEKKEERREKKEKKSEKKNSEKVYKDEPPKSPKEEKIIKPPEPIPENNVLREKTSSRNLNVLQSQFINDSSNSSAASHDESSIETPAKVEKTEQKKKDKNKNEQTSEKKRKRKHEPKEETVKIEEPPVKVLKVETEINQVQEEKKENVEQEITQDYMSILKELQHKIMTLQDNTELQRVVQLIAETGHYEITAQTFDFDLCALDRDTVRRLQEFFAVS